MFTSVVSKKEEVEDEETFSWFICGRSCSS